MTAPNSSSNLCTNCLIRQLFRTRTGSLMKVAKMLLTPFLLPPKEAMMCGAINWRQFRLTHPTTTMETTFRQAASNGGAVLHPLLTASRRKQSFGVSNPPERAPYRKLTFSQVRSFAVQMWESAVTETNVSVGTAGACLMPDLAHFAWTCRFNNKTKNKPKEEKEEESTSE